MHTERNRVWVAGGGCAAVLMLVAASVASGGVVVDWSGDYVSASRNFYLPATIDSGGTRTYPYSFTNPITPNAGYTAPAGKSGPLYGALESTCTDGTARDFAAFRVQNESTNDTIYLQGESQVAGSLRGLIFFKKSDFLGKYGTGNLSLDRVRGRINLLALGDSGSIRFAVRDGGGQWYVSQTVRTTTGILEMEWLSGGNWGAWDPTGAPLAALPVAYAVAGSAIQDVTAFGYYFTASRGHSTFSIKVGDFKIEQIPAPGTLVTIQ